MTALTVPARPVEDTGPRPVLWRRMAWVTWRQHRTALAGVAALLGALAVGLWLIGLRLHHAYAAAAACHPAASVICYDMFSSFNTMDGFLATGVILQVLPALIGAFAGAPVLARQTPFSPGLFGLGGPAFAAWTLAAFAIGALAGMLTRRVVPAIAATLAA